MSARSSCPTVAHKLVGGDRNTEKMLTSHRLSPEAGEEGTLLMRRCLNLDLKDEYKFSRFHLGKPCQAKARVFSVVWTMNH